MEVVHTNADSTALTLQVTAYANHYKLEYVAAVALTPLTTHPHTQAESVRSPVRGQEQEQPGVVPS